MLDADAARFDTRSNRTLNTPHTHLKRHKLQGPTPAAIPQCLLQVFFRFPPIAPPTSRDRDRSIADRRRRTSPCRSTISRERRGEVRRPRARLDREYSRDVETPRATLRRVVCTTHSRCASDASARDRDARARKIFRRAGARAEARRGAGSGRTDARWDGRAMVIRPRRRVILTRGVARDANEGGGSRGITVRRNACVDRARPWGMSRRDRAVGWEDVEDLGFLRHGVGDAARRRGRRGETNEPED